MTSAEITICSFMDLIPWFKKNQKRKTFLVICICSTFFLLGLSYCTQAGIYWVELLDNYSGNWGVLLLGALECISVTWVYGYNNFKRDISVMLGNEVTDSK
jgi:SNF family Na+-dependent transporter